ncbi:MAG TPA: DUF2318 domain-containing protein [Candidatus Bathyarchaeia archaeon]|nr:DUF2318 domain-containing protein [Candidatus Bathyarchaeia archaeon]
MVNNGTKETEMVNNETKKGKNTKLLAAIAVAAVLVAGGGFVVLSGAGGLLNGIGNAGNGNQQATDLSPAQGVVKIPLSSITNTLSFYTYESNGTAIKFFAVKGTDGNVHVAFDTCDVCGPKGYKQSGNDVVCNNCGKHFAINTIGTANVSGGCSPSHLPVNISGNSVIVKTSDLVTKESAFKT